MESQKPNLAIVALFSFISPKKFKIEIFWTGKWTNVQKSLTLTTNLICMNAQEHESILDKVKS